MKVEQIASLINDVTSEVVGESAIKTEDLSNVVDIGKQIFSVTDVDNYVKSLINHIGKVIFVNRKYSGRVPSVLMDSWEFGSVLEKVSADLPEAEENESWDLKDKTSYDPNIFYKPSVSVKFFNSKTTFEINMSFAEKQVKESFSSAEQLNGFLSMLLDSVEKSISIKLDALIMRTINNMTAQTLIDANNNTDVDMSSGTSIDTVRAVNLLARYNATVTTPIKAENALNNAEFIRYATKEIALYRDRIKSASTLFNVGGKIRFTPDDKLHFIALSDFITSSEIYLQSDTFHNELVRLPQFERVAYWQGTGTDFSFNSNSSIDVITNDEKTVKASGILAVMFDNDALGVSNLDRRVQTHFNPKGEFYTNFYKNDAGYFNDLNENFVVFFIADEEE